MIMDDSNTNILTPPCTGCELNSLKAKSADEKNDILTQLNYEIRDKNQLLNTMCNDLKAKLQQSIEKRSIDPQFGKQLQLLEELNKNLKTNNELIHSRSNSPFPHQPSNLPKNLARAVSGPNSPNVPLIILEPIQTDDIETIFKEIQNIIYINSSVATDFMKISKDKILIKCNNEDSVELLKNLIESKTDKVRLTLQKKKNPRIKTVGVLLDLSGIPKEDIKDEL